MVLKLPPPWYLTPRTIRRWHIITQSFPFLWCDVIFWCFSILLRGFSEYLRFVAVKGICWQVSSEIAKFPSAGEIDWCAIFHSTNRSAETSVPDSPLPFLLQTSKKGGIWWKGRTSADAADGPNCFFMAGLDVEKKDGEGTTPHSRRVSRFWSRVWRKF